MGLKGRIKSLLGMVSVESVHRGMKREDEAAERDRRWNESLIYGDGSAPPPPTPGEDDMALFVAGDIHFQEDKPQPAAPQPAVQPATPTVPKNNAARQVVAAALLGAGLMGGGVALNEAMKPDAVAPPTPPAVQPNEKPAPAPVVIQPDQPEFNDTIGKIEPDRD